MKEWKERSPNIYNQLDGASVDVMLGVKNIFDASDVSNGVVGGMTTWTELKEDGTVSTEFGPGTINVTLDDSKSDRDAFRDQGGEYTDNHEAGHAWYIINNIATYAAYYNNLIKNGLNPQGGHRYDDESGKKAKQYGKQKDIN